MKIKKILLITFFMFFFIIFFNTNAYSFNLNNSFSNLGEEYYSEQFKKWLALPEEEKNNYIMPNVYTTNLNIEKIAETQKDFFSKEDIQANASSLPEKYNIKDSVNIKVRNQKQTGFCWAFAASKVFETTEAKLNKKDTITEYSPRHMVYATSRYFKDNVENPTGFNLNVEEGGNYFISLAYYASGKGPILETDFPFVNSMDRIDISQLQNKQTQSQIESGVYLGGIFKKYSSNSITYTNGDETTYSNEIIEEYRNIIKTHIMKFGALSTMTYTPTSEADNYYSDDFNSFYCNNENLSSNHGVCLIGWDDTYSKTNFKAGCQPLSDGAYIALNSYGEDYNGNGGYFYISYDDIFVEQLLFGIQDISKKDYDHLYQYDELGSNPLAAIYNTINNKEIYGANYFKKESNKIEKLSEVGLFIETSCDVTIYLKNNPSDLNIKDLQPIATKKDLPHGYHIVKLNTPIEVGNNFAIIVKYSNDFIATLPIESNSLYVLYWDTAKANSGESFFSIDGEKWQDITSQAGKENANMCIKAFTIESNAISNSNYIQNSNWNILTNNNTKLLTGIDIDSTISQVLSSSNYISGYTAKAYINDVEVTSGKITTGTVIKIYNGSNIVDEYTTVIYGDTTGDGSVVSLDALVIIKNKLQTEKFKNNIFEQAGRVTLNTRNSNGVPSAVDALAVVKYKLGLEKITQ